MTGADVVQWMPIQNDSGETIPPYSLVRITGTDQTTGNALVEQIDADGDWAALVTDAAPIPDGEPGIASYSPRSIVAYERSEGLPAVGETWGPAAGFWGLKKDFPGWKIISDPGNPSTGLLAAVNATRQPPPFPLLCQVTVSGASHTVKRLTYSSGIVDFAPTQTFTVCRSTTGSNLAVGTRVQMWPLPDKVGEYWIMPAALTAADFLDEILAALCVVKSGGNVTDIKYADSEGTCQTVPECVGTAGVCDPVSTGCCAAVPRTLTLTISNGAGGLACLDGYTTTLTYNAGTLMWENLSPPSGSPACTGTTPGNQDFTYWKLNCRFAGVYVWDLEVAGLCLLASTLGQFSASCSPFIVVFNHSTSPASNDGCSSTTMGTASCTITITG